MSPVCGSITGSTAVIGDVAGTDRLIRDWTLFCRVGFSVVTILSPPVCRSADLMPLTFCSQSMTYSQKNAVFLTALPELAQPCFTCGGEDVASATGVAFCASAAAWLSL